MQRWGWRGVLGDLGRERKEEQAAGTSEKVGRWESPSRCLSGALRWALAPDVSEWTPGVLHAPPRPTPEPRHLRFPHTAHTGDGHGSSPGPGFLASPPILPLPPHTAVRPRNQACFWLSLAPVRLQSPNCQHLPAACLPSLKAMLCVVNAERVLCRRPGPGPQYCSTDFPTSAEPQCLPDAEPPSPPVILRFLCGLKRVCEHTIFRVCGQAPEDTGCASLSPLSPADMGLRAVCPGLLLSFVL